MAERKSKSLAATIVKTFTLDAPVERVYRAFTERRDLEEWLAAPYEIDAREGGAFAFGQMADGHTTSGKFVEVVPNKRLVYTWSFTVIDPKTRKVLPNWSEDRPTKVEITFERAGKGTKVTIRHEGFPEAATEYWPHEVGWEMLVGEVLRKYLEVPRRDFDAWWEAEGEAWQRRFSSTVDARARATGAQVPSR